MMMNDQDASPKIRCAAAILAAGFVVVLAAGCGRPAAAPAPADAAAVLPAVTVTTVAAQPEEIVSADEVVGTVRPKLTARLAAKVSGTLDEVNAEVGRAVKVGDLLAHVNARELQAQLDQARASRDQADNDLVRYTNLVEQGSTTRQEFENARTRQRMETGRVAELEAMLSYTRVLAPFAGVVTAKLADLGDLAVPGRVLFELEDPARLRLEALVPESLLAGLQAPGAVCRVRIDSAGVDTSAAVAEIAPAADSASRTFLVKFDLPSDPRLRTGQFGRAWIPAVATRAIRVPAAAVTRRGQMETVFVAENGRAALRLVRTGRRGDGKLEILSGITAGDRVIVSSPAALTEGQRLTEPAK